jgi:hypothetical protein
LVHRDAKEEGASLVDLLFVSERAMARNAFELRIVEKNLARNVEFPFLAVKVVARFGESQLTRGELKVLQLCLGLFLPFQPATDFREVIGGHWAGGDLVGGVVE